MSDGETVAEIELHNVKVARMLVDYWRRQGVETALMSTQQKRFGRNLGQTDYHVDTVAKTRSRLALLNHGKSAETLLSADAAQLTRVINRLSTSASLARSFINGRRSRVALVSCAGHHADYHGYRHPASRRAALCPHH